ncbi:MAG TPA: gluconokinase [Candidatus Corynebacterium gallistercoris]|uniref:Gluconokinase n=1 Tax=Candidatus Corynebacterium gallistercoris TaxID=2838530 RepID=A0A9D1RY53_9CORY|nr:gluconokinase [Candidatus Corynebacterium gallistercoris]
MGVSGSGKSTVGAALATLLDLEFVDGDDFHPQANIEKMSQGIPLTDEDRWPWLAEVGAWLANQPRGGVVACSALKKTYRDALLAACPRTAFVHCTGSKELLTERMGQRTKHFMPVHLLDSQLATLEALSPDEPGQDFDITPPVEEVAAEMHRWLLAR